MRIISGKYKSRRFEIPKSFKARPTTDFAKENLFNIIVNQFDLEGTNALDLFAGTGSISFELLSRGCKKVVCVEKEAAHYAFIIKVKTELKNEDLITIKGDVFRFIESCKQSFDFIFADPPYALKNLNRIPEMVFSNDLLKTGGVFVMEHPKEYDFSTLPYFSQKRVYGAVNFSFFRKLETENEKLKTKS
ncbi:MAG: 16S rRNA (guanine(966)-N(2))-methyltransferase RsmD [Dysgonamonadaceae bacterium]|jgi:16S rRNA (guanine(966)-N(2))-methyltransferase RsmD|nr:16S rRNA (guanine(966)-N(2))-methyltransferase RsmD [Dysgonamonadaceae bacterium]